MYTETCSSPPVAITTWNRCTKDQLDASYPPHGHRQTADGQTDTRTDRQLDNTQTWPAPDSSLIPLLDTVTSLGCSNRKCSWHHNKFRFLVAILLWKGRASSCSGTALWGCSVEGWQGMWVYSAKRSTATISCSVSAETVSRPLRRSVMGRA